MVIQGSIHFKLAFFGFWGEWHTALSKLDQNVIYPTNEFNDTYTIAIATANRDRIRDTYLSAFSNTKFMARYPWDSTFNTVVDIGFHNDFFMPEDGGSLRFDETVSLSGRWMYDPIGGEAPSEFEQSEIEVVFGTSRGKEMIRAGHCSTMQLDKPDDAHYLEQYMVLHRVMGCNFQIDHALFPVRVSKSSSFVITLSLANIEVAPFYHSWRVECSLLDVNDEPVVVIEANNCDLNQIQPEKKANIHGQLSTHTLERGNYRVGVRLIQPDAQLTKSQQWGLLARNTYIVLSNDLPVIEGQWNNANALTGGWAILDNVMVE